MRSSTNHALNNRGGILLSALVSVSIWTILLCGLANIQRSLTRLAHEETMRITALHLAEGLAEEGQQAPRGSVLIPRRSLRSLGSLRTDIRRLGSFPEDVLPQDFFIERCIETWNQLECVVVNVTWKHHGHIRRVTISLPRDPQPSATPPLDVSRANRMITPERNVESCH